MSIKLNYQLLTAQIAVETIKFLYEEEARFMKQHIWLFTDRQPEFVMTWNSGSLMLSQLQTIRAMMDEVAKLEEQQKKNEALCDPASLIGSRME